jgi:hypothetical protein
MIFGELREKYHRLIEPEFIFEHEPGWIGLLDEYFSVVEKVLPASSIFHLRQVKEKLGTLRIYTHISDDAGDTSAIHEAYRLASARSHYVCEYCGRPGVLRNRRGYYTTTCDEHAVRDGVEAIPVEPAPDIRVGSGGVWRRYDPDLDAFVDAEETDWSGSL